MGDALKTAFRLPQSALLFHLKNHYALIFAWREWMEPDVGDVPSREPSGQRWRRQILTARKRQKPSAWLDFDEVRETILGWKGYQILLLRQGQRSEAPSSVRHGSEAGSDLDEDTLHSSDLEVDL